MGGQSPSGLLGVIARFSVIVAVSLAASATARGQALLWDRTSPPIAQTVFGSAIWVISDMDADGVKDLLVGAPGFAGWYGIISGATGNTITERFGAPGEGLRPTGAVGDVDGDGFIDFLTVRFVPPGSGQALTELISGATLVALSTVSTYAMVYGTPLGDLNGDGTADFAIWTQGLWPTFGVAYGPLGQWAYSPTVPGCYSRSATVAPCGDVDQDGVPDFIVGVPCYPPTKWPQGLGFAGVFSGVNGTPIWGATGPYLGSHYGAGVTSPGDLDGDGVPDVVVSTPGYGSGAIRALSGSNGSQIATFTDPLGNYDWFGTLLVPLGDVDGDGVGDFATRGSEVDVFSGATMMPIAHIPTNLPTTPYWAGYAVGSAIAVLDDFNGDDCPEIVIGAPPISANLPGRIQCYTLRSQGVSVVGVGCPQPNGSIARIGATGIPHSNATFPMNLSRVSSGLGAALIIGLSNTQYGSAVLPYQVDPTLATGCVLYTSIDWFLSTVTTSVGSGLGHATIPVPIPPGVAGTTFFTQWAVFNPPGSPTLGSLTRSLAVTIQ